MRVILPQIAQMMQRNAASCIISQRKTVCGLFGFVACLRTYWGFICANSLSTLACYSPADSADGAEEYSKLYYPAEKDRSFEVVAVLLFWVLSA